jgi:NADP-dependent aldehyde dehydrogenase
MPDGVFSLVFGDGHRVGQALVANPAIKAVGFTGSRRGGMALVDVAMRRPEPIPVHAEMSSTNPSFLLPGALAARSGGIAAGFVDSLVLGAGQFCTNPGLVIGLEGEDLDAFCRSASAALAQKPAANMLTPGIHSSYCEGIARLAGATHVTRVGDGLPDSARYEARAALFLTSAERFLAEPLLQEEVFGPASLVVACRNADEMLALAEALPGQLTATLHVDEADHPLARRLMPVLERKSGRILCNDYPTGVEVAHAMVHGGPFPATSDGRTTSVGAAAMDRFLRPVCYQNVPDGLLPAALRTGNPMAVPRWRDGMPEA